MESPGEILKTARVAGSLTQRQLASRAKTAQSVVARIELGDASPTWATLAHLVDAAGFELAGELVRKPHAEKWQLEEIARILALSSVERIREARTLGAEEIIRVLGRRRVKFVLIGSLAARVQGFPGFATSVEITPARDQENLKRLATALRDLKANVYIEAIPGGLAFKRSSATLARGRSWSLITAAGRLDIEFQPPGTHGFGYLIRRGKRFAAFGVRVSAASIDDIIRSKERTGRARDRDDVALLRAMKRVIFGFRNP